MSVKENISSYPYLKQMVLCYLLLAVTDTVHHLHAAIALEQTAALHAVALGIVFIPLAMSMVWLYLRYLRKVFVGVFLAIAILATLVPGIYHGGWDHLVKILGYFRLNGKSTEISLLFPSDNTHYWFYEITGVFEFAIAVVCAYYIFKFLKNATKSA